MATNDLHTPPARTFVVVVTYNGMNWLERCLGSLRASAQPVRTVVVDNRSTDGSPAFVREHYPEVHLIESGSNLGFGRANNLGIAHALRAGADFVFLLNQDAWVEPGAIGRLTEAARAEPDYGIISPLHLNGQADALDKRFANYAAPPHCDDLFSDFVLDRLQERIYPCVFVNAAAWLLPRKTLETVGGFDPIFTHFGEDDNMVQRVKYHGFRIGICPQARICHDRPFAADDHRRRERLKWNLVKYSNVSDRGPELLKKDLRAHTRLHWLYRLTGKSDKATFHREEIAIIQEIREEVQRSWQTNQQPGPHYLDLAEQTVSETR